MNNLPYFEATVKYKVPDPNSEKDKKVTEKFLVRAENYTEAETRVHAWKPANWRDVELKLSQSPVKEIFKCHQQSETWWKVSILFENPESGKKEKYVVAANGGVPEDVIKAVMAKNRMADFESSARYKVSIDSDLI